METRQAQVGVKLDHPLKSCHGDKRHPRHMLLPHGKWKKEGEVLGDKSSHPHIALGLFP